MNKKRFFLAAAILATTMSTTSFSSDWDIHGYAKTGYTVDKDLNATDTELNKGDFFLGTNPGVPGNQFELSGSRYFKSENGAEGLLGFRAEYGNGTDQQRFLYSSSGGEGEDGTIFELKEAFIELKNLDFIPKDHKIWAGRRFYGRDSTALSGEFWKQSSGVGLGYDAGKFAVALVGADQDKTAVGNNSNKRQTVFVLDTRFKNFKVPGGSLEFQVNVYSQNDAKEETSNEDAADSGIGAGITYNINGFYGMKGWSKAAIAYGTGLGSTAKGLNFGDWLGGADKDGKSLLATTYGVWNMSDTIQIGTEASLHKGEKLYGQDDLTRMGFSINPSYKVTNNLRLSLEAAVGIQKLDDYKAWGRSKETETRTVVTLAPIFTLNNDYYGRPQIKPFITFASTSDDNVVILDDEQSGTFFGVQGEVWF